MDEKTLKIIRDRLESLPQNLRDMFMSAYYEDTLENIAKIYQLDSEQLNTLQKETSLVILGINQPEDFESELKKELIIDGEKISQITKEVRDKIFSKIREFLDIVNSPEYASPEKIEVPEPTITQNLDSRFDKLPENIQGVVEKSNYQNTLYEIARARKLSITQMGVLDAVTADLMVGAIHADQYRSVLLKQLGLPEADTTSLVNEINEKVFKTIRGGMMKMNEPKVQPSKSDLDTLKSHGIEILPETLEIEAPHPIIAQKMSTVVQTGVVKNNYEVKSTPPKAPEVKKPPKYAPGTDPYRVSPE